MPRMADLTMLPETFEAFLEQGASKIDASVRELQRTYDEVVWGVERPPSYIEKKAKEELPPHHDSNKNNKIASKKRSNKQNSFGQVLTPRSVRQNRQRQQENQLIETTPSTVKDVESLFGDNDMWSYQESTTSLTSSDSDIGVPKNTLGSQPSRVSWKFSGSNGTNNNSIRCESPVNSIVEQPNKSIDEIFGYNTRQSIRKRKAYADQDVGLDFCLIDAPTGDDDESRRSLLIVQRIDPKGLFAKTGLGLGDAVLAINGVSFREDEQPLPHGLHRRKKKKNKKGKNNNGGMTFKPNLFKARALLNGRGLIVTIDYQKFGETSASLEPQQRDIDKGVRSSNGDKETPVNNLNQDYPQAADPQRTSAYPSRRPQNNSSTRVDFLGMLRSSDKSSEKKKDPKISLESTEYSTRSHSTRATLKTANTKNSQQGSNSQERTRKSDGDLEAPPKISRLTRLKVRTKRMRMPFGNSKNGRASMNDGKENVQIKSDAKDSSFQPYQSLLSDNNGPEEQIKLLRDRVWSSSTMGTHDDPPSILEELGDSEGSADVSSPANANSPARSTHSESYLQELRKHLSSTANEILNDLSFGKKGQLGDINEKSTGMDEEQEMIRIKQKFVEVLQIQMDSLKSRNKKLSDDLSSLRRRKDGTAEKLEQAERQLEQAAAKAQVYESELGLFQSRLEISKIQADKRHREMEAEKEKSVAENDKVIADLSKRIENLEEANRQLLEKLRKVETKKQEKYNSLQAQFERLKMKFSAQSTLLDNVMTSNEELTSQNEALEAELSAAAKQRTALPGPISNATGTTTPATTGMLFPETSDYDDEHTKNDPILLSQATQLSSLREENGNLEDKVESLTHKLEELREKQKEKELKEKTSSNSASEPDPKARSSPLATRNSTRSLLDVTITSSGDSADSDKSVHHRRASSHRRPPLPRRRAANPNNISMENPSDESIGAGSSVDKPIDEEVSFDSSAGGGCLQRLQASNDASETSNHGLCDPDTILNLRYQHQYEDDQSFDDQDEDETTINSEETETMGNRRHHKDSQNPDRSTLVHSTLDESFESVSSLFLMERILELETALKDTKDLDSDQKQRFLISLQSRISKLREKGYERLGSVEVVSNDEGNFSVEVTTN